VFAGGEKTEVTLAAAGRRQGAVSTTANGAGAGEKKQKKRRKTKRERRAEREK
jgi:hypothetical protein